MTMDRREFVRFLALTCAGAAAQPEQIAAFEHYYNVNTPYVESPLIAVDEIQLCGLATKSTRILIELMSDMDPMRIGLNAFGGVIRWVATPMQFITTTRLSWHLTCLDKEEITDEWVREFLVGHLSYIDQSGIRHMEQISAARGAI